MLPALLLPSCRFRLEANPIKSLEGKLRDFAKVYESLDQWNYVGCGSSSALSTIPDASIDYIFIDPPFGDNLNYAQLNLLWEGWLRLRTNVAAEAIVDRATERDLAFYQEKLRECLGTLRDQIVGLFGLSFKPNTDDMREAPSLTILPILQEAGALIHAYDPEGAREAARHLDVDLCADAYEAISGADGVVILTEWNEFRALDLARMKRLLKKALMVDLRNIYRPQQMSEAGFAYFSLGRPWIEGRTVLPGRN